MRGGKKCRGSECFVVWIDRLVGLVYCVDLCTDLDFVLFWYTEISHCLDSINTAGCQFVNKIRYLFTMSFCFCRPSWKRSFCSGALESTRFTNFPNAGSLSKNRGFCTQTSDLEMRKEKGLAFAAVEYFKYA